MSSDFGAVYYSIPFFTRWWLTLTLGLSLIGRFDLIDPYYFILWFERIFSGYQIWRPITALFYYPITPQTGFHFIINCLFLYQYSKRLETETYLGKPADYFFLLLFNWACCVILGLYFNVLVLMDPMVLSVLYVWCQINKDVIVSFWFGARFKAMYLPWVLLLFNFIVAGGGLRELLGILIGHLYFFLMFKYPQELGGAQLISTPSILKQFFPDQRTGVHGFGVQPPASARPANRAQPQQNYFGGHNWGRGYNLND